MDILSLISRFFVAAILFPLGYCCFLGFFVLYFPAPQILRLRIMGARLAAKRMISNPKMGERRWRIAVAIIRLLVALFILGAIAVYGYELQLFMTSWLGFEGQYFWFWFAGAVIVPILPGYFLFRYIIRQKEKNIFSVIPDKL